MEGGSTPLPTRPCLSHQRAAEGAFLKSNTWPASFLRGTLGYWSEWLLSRPRQGSWQPPPLIFDRLSIGFLADDLARRKVLHLIAVDGSGESSYRRWAQGRSSLPQRTSDIAQRERLPGINYVRLGVGGTSVQEAMVAGPSGCCPEEVKGNLGPESRGDSILASTVSGLLVALILFTFTSVAVGGLVLLARNVPSVFVIFPRKTEHVSEIRRRLSLRVGLRIQPV